MAIPDTKAVTEKLNEILDANDDCVEASLCMCDGQIQDLEANLAILVQVTAQLRSLEPG